MANANADDSMIFAPLTQALRATLQRYRRSRAIANGLNIVHVTNNPSVRLPNVDGNGVTDVLYQRGMPVEIMDAQMEMIVNYVNQLEGRGIVRTPGQPSLEALECRFFSLTLMNGLGNNSRSTLETRRRASHALRELGYTPDEFLTMQHIFIPIHYANHWSLVVISPLKKRVEHLNSANDVHDTRHVLRNIFSFLAFHLGIVRFIPTEWSWRRAQSPQQPPNDMNCGTYTVTNALMVALRYPIYPGCYDDDHIRVRRERICVEVLAHAIGTDPLNQYIAGNLPHAAAPGDIGVSNRFIGVFIKLSGSESHNVVTNLAIRRYWLRPRRARTGVYNNIPAAQLAKICKKRYPRRYIGHQGWRAGQNGVAMQHGVAALVRGMELRDLDIQEGRYQVGVDVSRNV